MPVDFSLFHHPDFGGEGIARSWVDKATQIRGSQEYHQEFDRFSYLWMAFNSWGMCVTLAETDAAMLRSLKADRDVNDIFENVIRSHRFRDAIRSVERSFPLASFSDLLRLDPTYNWRGEKDTAYWQKIAEAPRGKPRDRSNGKPLHCKSQLPIAPVISISRMERTIAVQRNARVAYNNGRAAFARRMSATTISSTIASRPVHGTQPSLCSALLASPIRASTSAGR